MSSALNGLGIAASQSSGVELQALVMGYILEQTGGRARKLHVEITARSAHIAGRVSSYIVQRIAMQAARNAIHALIDLVANPQFRPTIIRRNSRSEERRVGKGCRSGMTESRYK